MFREDFSSPTGLIRRCLIYSLPQFPSSSIRCWDSPCRASHLLRAWFSKLSARDANVHLSNSTWSLTCARLPLKPAFWMQWCFCSWTAPQFSVPCNSRRNTKYISHPLRRSDLQKTKKNPPEIFRAPQHCDAPLEGGGRGKLSSLLLCFEWTHICVSNKEPFLH